MREVEPRSSRSSSPVRDESTLGALRKFRRSSRWTVRKSMLKRVRPVFGTVEVRARSRTASSANRRDDAHLCQVHRAAVTRVSLSLRSVPGTGWSGSTRQLHGPSRCDALRQ